MASGSFRGQEGDGRGRSDDRDDHLRTAVLDATLSGKLSPDGTKGIEWVTFTLTLDEGDLVCDGTMKVKRYAVADGLWTVR